MRSWSMVMLDASVETMQDSLGGLLVLCLVPCVDAA
jgi:hypothetical protein